MAGPTQDAPGYYVWQVPGKSVVVHLHLDVIERLSSEVMRGFGAVPKRGAEVGGVLLGTIEQGGGGDDPAIVRVEDFEPVECEYKRGPSYLFTDEEKDDFEDAVQRWQPDPSRTAYVVGFFRSQTREGMALAVEDIELLDEFFPDPENIALLIKPFGTKVSEAGFFFREDGAFPEVSPLEFPFRRRELTGEEPPPRRSMMERRPRNRGSRGLPERAAPTPISQFLEPAPEEVQPYRDYQEPEPIRPVLAGSAYATTLPSRSRFNASVWIPLSFVFLLFGVALGYMIALASGRPPKVSNDPQDFALGLSVARSDDNLVVKWDRMAPAIRAAAEGSLEIEENGVTKPVGLSSANLQSGSVVVQRPTHSVRFRLTVHPQAHLSLTESTEWRP
jgi:hypothetical protein